MKRYSKNYKTLHVNKFLNQKELNAKEYAKKEGINPSTFRGWVSDATSPSIRSHKPKKVTTKATTKISSSTTKPAFAENTNKYEYIIIGYGVLVTLVLLIAAVCYIIK